jgi:hypothetical protein
VLSRFFFVLAPWWRLALERRRRALRLVRGSGLAVLGRALLVPRRCPVLCKWELSPAVICGLSRTTPESLAGRQPLPPASPFRRGSSPPALAQVASSPVLGRRPLPDSLVGLLEKGIWT